MTVERPRWLLVMVGVSAALFAVFAVSALERDAPAPRVVSRPAGPAMSAGPPTSVCAPTSTPAAAETGTPSRVPAAGAAGIPTRTMPCVDGTVELLANPQDPEVELLCWGDHCLRYPFQEQPVPRPAASREPEPEVGPDEVCTDTRCDPLGPRLRAALDREPQGASASATQDHAKIAFSGTKIWDRASDRLILERLDASRVEIVGNRLLAVTEPGRWGGRTAAASLLDARGRARGRSFPILSGGAQGESTLVLDERRFLTFGGNGEITLIDHDHVAELGRLLSPQSAEAIRVRVRAAVRLKSTTGSDRAAILWCTDGACNVTRVLACRSCPSEWSPMTLHEDAVLPRCGE